MSLFPDTPTFSSASMLRRDQWLIRLRWFAIMGLLLGVLLLKIIELGPSSSILWMGITGGFMILLNLSYFIYTSGKRQFGKLGLVALLNLQMVLDLVLLTFIVFLTGSEESPLIFFYVFHIILASLIFPGGFSYLYSLLVIVLFSALLILEHSSYVDHVCFFHEINLSGDINLVIAIWFVFVITMITSAYLAQNVTSRHRRVREKLELVNSRLLEVNKSKTTFFRYASHEMKAPVATIQSTLMVIEEVLGKKVDERVTDMLRRAIGRTEDMIEMLKDLADLTYGKLQDSQKFENLDLKQLLGDLVSEAQPNVDRKYQTLSYESPVFRCEFFGDRIALNKIFTNLISNAMRYTQEKGEIKIILRKSGTSYTITVADNGPGIPESEHINIFKEFYRTPSAKKHISDGTGLGLAIVMRLVEMHDGNVQVQSQEGAGSQFIVELPFEEHL